MCADRHAFLHHMEVSHAGRFDARCRHAYRDVRRLCCGADRGATCRPARSNWPNSPTPNAGPSDRGISPRRLSAGAESAAVNDIVRRYARLQVPRYTSYPTAAEFTTDGSVRRPAAVAAGSGYDRSRFGLSACAVLPRTLPLLRLQYQESAARRRHRAYRRRWSARSRWSATLCQGRFVSRGCTGAVERRASSALTDWHP